MSRISPAMMAATKWWFSGFGRHSGFSDIGEYVDRARKAEYVEEEAPFEVPVLVDLKAVRKIGLGKSMQKLRIQADDWPKFVDVLGEGMPAMYWMQVALVERHIANELIDEQTRPLNLGELIALVLSHAELLEGTYVASGSINILCSEERPAFVLHESTEEIRGGGFFTWGLPSEMDEPVFVPLCRTGL